MYVELLDTSYVADEVFKDNFMGVWSEFLGENHIIKELKNCDFKKIQEWHQGEKQKMKDMSKEEKKAKKLKKTKEEEKYMLATVDGVERKVKKFRIPPPGLFIGRGDNSKRGKLKRRIMPTDIIINIGTEATVPEPCIDCPNDLKK